MHKKLLLFVIILFSTISFSQLVINEVDADNPGSDVNEFVEIKSTVPNFSLNGYVLVFFNGGTSGTTKTSYLAIDLDGYSTNINGIVHFGNPFVSPTPAGIIPQNGIQNGPDGVAIYIGNDTDFPINTTATTTNLIDGLAYTGSTTVNATALMAVFGTLVCPYDFQASNSVSKSIQRKNDGTFEVKVPTPGVPNDGSGIVLNYVTITTNFASLVEGQNLLITATTSTAVAGQPLVFSFTLDNGSFSSADYSGLTSITIPVGAISGSASVQILNDGSIEGDEELKITFGSTPSNYSLYNNNKIIRVDDANFTVSNFGTPLNPTYGNVSSTAPMEYYSSIEGLSGAALKQELQNIIANPNVVHAHNYGDIVDILKIADQNPQNSSKVWLMYVEQSRSKIDFQETSSNIGKWNREHIYAQSRGGFADATSNVADGIDIWLPSNANDLVAGHADAHHLRAEDGAENSARSNRNYGIDYNGPTGNSGSWRGDVARALFYMAVRYNALSVVNGNPADSPTTMGTIGDLSSLLNWNVADPRDDFEMNRNNYIYTWQVNRNPFIDYPNLANYVFGANYGQPWFSTLSNASFEKNTVVVYPNPANNRIYISGIDSQTKLQLFSVQGSSLFEDKVETDTEIDVSNLATGIYILKTANDKGVLETKIILE